MVIKIPERFKDFNFVLVNGKVPIKPAWQKKDIRIGNEELQKHLESGKNYGVRGGGSSPIIINGKSHFLLVVDFDDKKIQGEILSKLPETFTTKSGGKGLPHLWFASDDDKSYAIKDEKLSTLIDVIGEGKQVVGVGSVHVDTGKKYEIVNDIDFAFIAYSELKAILMPYDKSPKKVKKPSKKYKVKDDDISGKLLDSVSMEQVLSELGIDTAKNPTECPFHSSSGGKCMGWGNETAHCFHCDGKWNKYSLIREAKKLTDKQTFEWFADKTGMRDELEESRKKYNKKKNAEKSKKISLDDSNKLQPIFYDKKGMWWMWNNKERSWEMADDVDILNHVETITGEDIISPQNRTLILNSLKQKGRRRKLPKLPKFYIQFKDKVFDIKTKKEFEATPDFFYTNPLPFNLGDSEDTPTIDKLFKEWVVEKEIQDESYINTLYEILAYSSCHDQFLQRIIALTGSGSNGKGTFLLLIKKFLGIDNCCSSNLKTLSTRNFESSALYKKLVCFFGEVDGSDLTNTNLIKSLTGEDLIRYEFKGSTPFSEESGTTPIIATNSLPLTPDKSIGFYRRWLIVDFPHQFKIKRDLLSQIPNKEFENLGRKIVNILTKLYSRNEFTNAGTIAERTKKYELRSNPLVTFISENYVDNGIGKVRLRIFANSFNKYLKEKRLRPLTITKIGKLLRDDGYEIQSRDFPEGDKSKAIIGLVKSTDHIAKNGSLGSFKEEENQPKVINPIPVPPKKNNYSEDFSK